jgi:N-acetyl-gamma-glutamylphosphate reductase
MSKTEVGIIKVTGYVGVELAVYYAAPEGIGVNHRTHAAGHEVGKVFPHLANIDLTIEAKLGDVEIAFQLCRIRESAKEILLC